MVQATSANGHSSNCSDLGTSCHLNSLVCGQEYSVVVEAVDPGCPGPASVPTTITTGECTVAFNTEGVVLLLKILTFIMFPPSRALCSYECQLSL